MPKSERIQAATNIVMGITYQLILCFDTYAHCIQHKLQRTRYVVTSKDDIDQTRQVKTCDICRKDTQTAVLVPSLQFVPGGQKLIEKAIKMILKGLQQPLKVIDRAFEDANYHRSAERNLMKIICSRPSLLCCTCFFPIYYNLQVIYSPLGSTEDADEAISVFAILQQYLDQLSMSIQHGQSSLHSHAYTPEDALYVSIPNY